MSHVNDSTKTISSSFTRFFSGTLLSRFSGLGREIVMAASFGTLPLVASFWMAFRFAHLLRRLFGEGALHIAFVPHFEHLRKVDPSKAASFFAHLSSYLFKVLLTLTLICEAILISLLLFASLSASSQEILFLTALMLPAVIFICLHALNSSLLHCEKHFFLPSASPVILNLTWILTVWLLWGAPTKMALTLLSIVVVIGFAFQWLSTYIPARAFLKTAHHSPKDRTALLGLIRPFFLSVLGVAATQINNALDALFARSADLEGPAYLWYALRIEQLPLGLLGVSLSSALLPPIARAIADRDMARYTEFLQAALKRTFAFMIPITGGILTLGFVSVNLLYGRGAFTEHSLLQTTYCLFAYSLGLTPMALVLILAAAFYAQKEYRLPTFISLGAVLLNVTLNALFVYLFHLGAVSIALATSIAALFNALGLCFFLKVRIPSIAKIVLTTLFASLVTLFLAHLLHLPRFPTSLLAQLLQFFLQTFLYGSLILLFSYLFKAQDILSLLPSRLKLKFIK